MAGSDKASIPGQTCSYKSLSLNSLEHNRSCSEGDRVPLGVLLRQNAAAMAPLGNKENTPIIPRNKWNAVPSTNNNNNNNNKENSTPSTGGRPLSSSLPIPVQRMRCSSTSRILQPSSLNSDFEPEMWEPISSEDKHSSYIWDYSDSDAAPASSWSTLPNRSLLSRPLPLDVGKCTCVIVKEKSPDGLRGTVYSLYTNEGKGRQDRHLAVAHHRRPKGKSEFTVAQNIKGIKSCSDDSFIGIVTANLMGSKYHIWDQGNNLSTSRKQSKLLLASITFRPTISTCTGSHRSLRVWVPKHQSMQLKSTTQSGHIKGLPNDWEARMDKVHHLFSRVPQYNKSSKQYELDYRDRGRAGLLIKSSVKNFQLTLQESGRQTILQLGRVGKSKYVMDYRHPLTGYQAFCICLASIDSKLCCTV